MMMSSRRSILASALVLHDCPICLEEMQDCDYAHLLQCNGNSNCRFNMCSACIESLISSSKDGFEEASDGNYHVKVYLHCPNCRSNLSHSIRDTLLLRKVLGIVNSKIPDSDWTESQIRLKKALDTDIVQNAIKNARKMEAEYFGTDDDLDEGKLIDSLLQEYGEHHGFEADISTGVHASFYAPKPPEPLIREEAIRVDPTLFAGLDYFLTEDERRQVTGLMTTGDPFLLAEAAEILFAVAQNISSSPSPQKPSSKPKRTILRRSSVFQLIAEAEAAHGGGRKQIQQQSAGSRIAQRRQLEREFKLRADFQRRFPCPVRLPKAVQLDLSLPFDMEFIDYTWDGTVIDAYTKISVGFRNRITQKRPGNVHVGNILGTEETYVNDTAMGCAIGLCFYGDEQKYGKVNDVYVAFPGQSRVLISQTGRIGKQGGVRGDVLSHIDGKDISGMDVKEALALLQSKERQGKCIMLTLNAELSVAEALKRRAMAISKI